MSQAMTMSAGQTVLLATFFVRDTLCALDATGVQEVIRLGPITEVRYAPAEVLGVVNLRGTIVTIPQAVVGPDTRIFIVEDRNEFMGLLVDRVDEVVEVERDDRQPTPANVNGEQARYFRGVCRAGGRAVTLLDAGRFLAEE
ncbi:MAG: chemotaxis protein CheW [Bryobacteraceae bacterium]|jgi:purine-binding chemotaxis protein CheW